MSTLIISNQWNIGKSSPPTNWPQWGFKVLFLRYLKTSNSPLQLRNTHTHTVKGRVEFKMRTV